MTEEVYTAQGVVRQNSIGAFAEGTHEDIKLSSRGEVVVCDFYTEMALEGRAYNVSAGTITTPITGDVLITDTKAEMALDIHLGIVAMPVWAHIAVRGGIGNDTGTLHEYAAKSVAAAVTTHGTAFIPLPLKIGGIASHCVASTGTAGTVVVAAELATTTRVHWHTANPVAIGAGNEVTNNYWTPRIPPILAGVSSFYIQIAGAGVAPDYYAAFDYIELPTVSVN